VGGVSSTYNVTTTNMNGTVQTADYPCLLQQAYRVTADATDPHVVSFTPLNNSTEGVPDVFMSQCNDPDGDAPLMFFGQVIPPSLPSGRGTICDL
jgi:hypothetical protein